MLIYGHYIYIYINTQTCFESRFYKSMSILSSLVLISLLCLISSSTPSIASRRLTGDVIVTPEPPRNATFHQPIKNNSEKLKAESTIDVNVNAKHRMKKERTTKRKSVEDGEHKPENGTKQDGRQGRATRAYAKNPGKVVKSKFGRVVSWRVPRSKNEVPQTGFNLDYAPPKVHPPTHN